MEFDNLTNEPPAVIDEAEAGRAAKVRKEINKLISETNEATFTLMDLLHESKTKGYFRKWGFESFSNYAKSLKLKYAKSYYLVAIKKAMMAAGIAREDYEPVGLAKLRVIAKLNPEDTYNGIPGTLAIFELTMKAGQLSAEEVQLQVDTLMGNVEDESMVWLNIHLKKSARDNVLRPAIELAKKHIGSVGVDEDGVHKDASDGAALEVICGNFLADPNFTDPDASEEQVQTSDTPTYDDAIADTEAAYKEEANEAAYKEEANAM